MTVIGMRRWLALVVILALCAGLVAVFPLPPRPVAAAEIAPAAGEGGADATGRFATSIPIQVPAFRGLEPSLRLRYDSGTGTGFVGVGWTLTGVSFVERAGPMRGVARYDNDDIFLLDGQELLPCTTFGGTHCTKQQNFQRIRWDPAGNRWQVWETDGTQSVYGAVYTTGLGTFRWALTSETDTHGNTVSYAYTPLAPPENVYLDSISYNGTVVKLWREPRPDKVSFTNGETVGQTTRRLKTIQVSTGGTPVQAYRLDYAEMANSNRSVLTSVRRYGRDANVDASGTVSGGTSLPAVTMAYQGGVSRLADDAASNRSVGDWGSSTNKDLFGDVNGDGRIDLVRVHQDGTNARARVSLSDGDGFAAPAWDGVIGGWSTETTDQLTDVNGDGRADLVRLWHNGTSTYAQVNPSTGAGYPNQSFNSSVGTWNPTGVRDFLTDIDGDYRADFVRIWQNGSDSWVQVNRSNGSGYPDQNCNTSIGTWHDSTKWYPVDVNGDARADLARVYNLGNGNASLAVRLTDGRCFPDQTFNSTIGGWNPEFQYHFNDLNADGKADLVVLYEQSPGNAFAQVNMSTGLGYPTQTSNSPIGSWDPAARVDRFGDINGDGRTDLVRFYSNGGNTFAMIRPFNGHDFANLSFNQQIGGSFNTAYKHNLVDVSGDGKADSVRIYNFGSGIAAAMVHLAEGPTPDLLTSLGNGIGGTISVTYSPSSRWWNDAADAIPSMFATVASVTRNDGRGTSFTTSYTFADARWVRDPAERRFLGFGSSTTVIDGDGTRQRTFYRQTLAGTGSIDRAVLTNARGDIYYEEQRSYVETTAPPYQSQLAGQARLECNLGARCLRSATDYNYDTYNNVTLEVDQGDADRSGDERATVTTFAPNLTAYITSLPAARSQHAGTSSSGTQLTRSVFFYDSAGSSSTPPAKGDLTRTDVWNSSNGAYITASSAYDSFGNATSTTDARGSTSTTTYDPTYHLFATRVCNALTQCTDTTWDFVLGLPLTVTDPNNAVTATTYDALGRVRTTTDPAGKVTTTEYLNMGNPAQQKVRQALPDATTDGLWTETFYDGLGRSWQTVKEGPAAGVTYVQDRVFRSTTNLVWKESLWRQSGQPARYTVHIYDGADRLTSTTHPSGASRTVSYATILEVAFPTAFNVVTTTYLDELGHARTTHNDTDGRIVKALEHNGTSTYTTRYSHDLLGRLTRWTDAAGNSSTVSYNSLGWKTSMTDMDAGTWSYAYDSGGLITGQTDAKNQATTTAYDTLGRRSSLTYPDGSQARWFYDEPGHGASVGRLTRATYPGGSEDHSWDSRGLETSTVQCVDSVCMTTTMAYDSLGRLATLTYPDGEAVAHTYNPAGQLSTVAGYVSSMTWSPAGQLTGLSYTNGTSTSFSYDANREWLTAATVIGPGGAARYAATYGYNQVGLVTTMTQGTPTAATTTYTYDDLNRLLTVSGAQSQTFTYNAIGDITSNSAIGPYTYSDPAHKHAVTAAGPATYAYDGNGNMLTGDGRTLTWDGSNRLASITRAGVTTTFAYDAGERRLKKASGASTTRYLSKHLEEINGALVKYYFAGPILVARSSGGVKVWYHADRLGSTRLMTDASGAEVRDYDYKPFGDLQSTSGPAANERDFTGHIRDTESGLLYMTARYHDPKLGRFISPDTVIPKLDNPQDINRYSYVRNNPINNTDPTGHIITPPCPDNCDWGDNNPGGVQKKTKKSGGGGGKGGGGNGGGSGGRDNSRNRDISAALPDDPADRLRRVCRGDPDSTCAGTASTPATEVLVKELGGGCQATRVGSGSIEITCTGRPSCGLCASAHDKWDEFWRWYHEPRYSYRTGRLIGGMVNVGLGAFTFTKGSIRVLSGGTIATTLPGIGEVPGAAVMAVGSLQVLTGAARTFRGYEQIQDVRHDSYAVQNGAAQIADAIGAVLPPFIDNHRNPGGWLDYLGSLPVI
ncbi:MAG TPA: RHS repeat-associated core domain-containing protein [Candidatus Limnocylindrales bacterium]|nr:RHS repeat-associated core domain-containing protein [Candidatus Limnocylindrales bacterium]